MAVNSIAHMAMRIVVTTCPFAWSLTTPNSGIGAVGCTMIIPMNTASHSPRLRFNCTGAVEAQPRAVGCRIHWDYHGAAHGADAAVRRRERPGEGARSHDDPHRHVRDAIHRHQLRPHGARLSGRGQ